MASDAEILMEARACAQEAGELVDRILWALCPSSELPELIGDLKDAIGDMRKALNDLDEKLK